MLSRLMTRREQAVLAFLATAIVVGAVAVLAQRRHSEEAVPAQTALPGKPLESAAAAPASLPASPPPMASLEPMPEPSITPPPPRESADSARNMKKISVAVDGAVASPGLYQMHEGDRVADLIENAGGTVTDADLSTINLAAQLLEATTLSIPYKSGPQRDGNALRWERANQTEAINPPAYLRAYQGIATQTASAQEPKPAEAPKADDSNTTTSSLININTATAEELETLPGVGPVTAKSIVDYRQTTPFATVDDLDNVSGIGPAKLAKLRPLVCVK